MTKSNKKVIEEWKKLIEGKKTYTIVCKICEKVIGESENDDNGNSMCLDCYNKN